jgi:hypothetical protein
VSGPGPPKCVPPAPGAAPRAPRPGRGCPACPRPPAIVPRASARPWRAAGRAPRGLTRAPVRRRPADCGPRGAAAAAAPPAPLPRVNCICREEACLAPAWGAPAGRAAGGGARMRPRPRAALDVEVENRGRCKYGLLTSLAVVPPRLEPGSGLARRLHKGRRPGGARAQRGQGRGRRRGRWRVRAGGGRGGGAALLGSNSVVLTVTWGAGARPSPAHTEGSRSFGRRRPALAAVAREGVWGGWVQYGISAQGVCSTGRVIGVAGANGGGGGLACCAALATDHQAAAVAARRLSAVGSYRASRPPNGPGCGGGLRCECLPIRSNRGQTNRGAAVRGRPGWRGSYHSRWRPRWRCRRC